MRRIHFVFSKLKYNFDTLLARGLFPQVVWLALILIGGVFSAACLIWFFQIGGPQFFPEVFWLTMLHAIDAGAAKDIKGPFSRVIVLLAVTFFGIFTFSALVALVNNAIRSRLDTLRRGRSKVIERGHLVIYGWSRIVIPIVQQISMATLYSGRSSIVIYGDYDQASMEAELIYGPLKVEKTRVVCRSGATSDLNGPVITSADTARSVIVVGSDGKDHDIDVVKAVLAVVNNPFVPVTCPIVAAVREPQNVDLLKIASRNRVEVILIAELIGHLIARMALRAGLPPVYRELLDFEGSEFYLDRSPSPRLCGKSFYELMFAFDTSTLVGICKAKHGHNVSLLPPRTDLLEPGDWLVLVAEDKTKIMVDGIEQPQFDGDALAIMNVDSRERKPMRSLILGANHSLPVIVSDLAQLMPDGSTLHVATSAELSERIMDNIRRGVNPRCDLKFSHGDLTDRLLLDKLLQTQYESIIIVGDYDLEESHESDTTTLATLLQLRDILERQPNIRTSIVTEMRDPRNRLLAEAGRADDFVVSEEIISLMLSQLSENVYLAKIFEKLFSFSEIEIDILPVENYVKLQRSVTFFDVTEAAARRSEVALGYRLAAEATNLPNHGVYINPAKSKPISFQATDKIIALCRRA
jgi:voltage-gated potassium channel Kch